MAEEGKKYICCDCGQEQDDMDTPCTKCGGPRVVLRSLIEDVLGVDLSTIEWVQDKELEPGDTCEVCGNADLEATGGPLGDGIYVLCPSCGYDSSPPDDQPINTEN